MNKEDAIMVITEMLNELNEKHGVQIHAVYAEWMNVSSKNEELRGLCNVRVEMKGGDK